VRSISICQNGSVFVGTGLHGAFRLIKGTDSLIAPLPLSPIQHANGVSTTPVLVWNRCKSADRYFVELSADSLFQREIISAVSTSGLSFAPPPLDHSRRYFWRVSGVNKYWTTKPSAIHDFVTADPSAYSLMQNYPNPFNSSTTIQFSVPRHSRVELQLLTITGQSVLTVLSKQVHPGDHRLLLNAGALSSGVYILTLQAEGYLAARKLILIK